MSTVYVLGAGATKALNPSAPINDELLPAALRHESGAHTENLADFISEFYGAAVPSLEDLLTQLDVCLNEKRPIAPHIDEAKLISLRRELVAALCRLLGQVLGQRDPVHGPGGSFMDSFLERIGPEDAILSLNYDLLVEESLIARFNRAPDYEFPARFCLEPNGNRMDDVTQMIRERDADAAKMVVLKPHGSLNWLYCPACREVDCTPGVKGVVYALGEEGLAPCYFCGVPYQPLIIVPTLLKSYDLPQLGRIWIEAENRLSQASEVVFIGYSLPVADSSLRSMFCRAAYRRRRTAQADGSGDRWPVTVVNMGRDCEARYRQLLGDVDFIDTGFEDYVTNKMQ